MNFENHCDESTQAGSQFQTHILGLNFCLKFIFFRAPFPNETIKTMKPTKSIRHSFPFPSPSSFPSMAPIRLRWSTILTEFFKPLKMRLIVFEKNMSEVCVDGKCKLANFRTIRGSAQKDQFSCCERVMFKKDYICGPYYQILNCIVSKSSQHRYSVGAVRKCWIGSKTAVTPRIRQ